MTELSAGHGPRGSDAATILDLDAVAFGPFSLRSRLLEKDGLPVRLGSRATDILRLLVGRAGEVVPKNEILGYAWSGLSVEEVSLRVHVAELRKVLGDGKDGARYITNIPGRGYCFVAPVRRGGRAEVATPASRVPERAAPPPSLPRRLDRMVGREDAVAELAARLLRDRFVTLRGPGGIGKTTVATALAHEMCDSFDGNVHFLEFGPLKDGALVASTVAAALGLVVHHEDPSASIVNFLRGRRLLLVLDSCEHVIEEVARLAENIYREAPGIVILATSRESLLVKASRFSSSFRSPVRRRAPASVPARCLLIPPCACSSIAPSRRGIATTSPTRMPKSWPGFAASSTASRWRSSWLPHVSVSMDCARWRRCSTTGCSSNGAGGGRRRRGSRRSALRSTGVSV
jgi:DNA-binding winged helix-turn-helix (wHTH) protein